MPYLSFDLDALERVPDVADAAGLRADTIAYGLLRLWRHAWREKTDSISPGHLAGFFPGAHDAGQLASALTTFNFIEPAGGGAFRIRGAERYLRISKARSAGGKAASGNLKRGDKLPGSVPAQAGEQPGKAPGSVPALTASSEQRAANTQQRSAAVDPSPLQRMLDDREATFPTSIREEYPALQAVYENLLAEAALAKVPTSRLEAAHRVFLHDDYWSAQPQPCPFRAFVKNWRRWVPGQAAEPAAPTHRILEFKTKAGGAA